MTLKDAILEAPLPDMKGGVAITRYLKKTLRRDVEFKRPNNVARPKKQKNSSAAGLTLGRQKDHAVTSHYTGGKRIRHDDTRTHRIVQYIETTLGIKVVTAQYPVSVVFNSHKLKTKVDMVGYREEKRDASGNVTHPAVIVAIELKCTTNTIDVHRQLYDLPCGAGMLSNHLPDTELVHHQLQTAFGVLGVAARVGPKYRVIGRVVVSAADGETSYACSSVYVNERFFMVAPAGGPPARAPKVNCSIQLITMPRNNADRRPILDAFCDTFGAGYKDVVEDHPCKASFVVRHRTTPQKVVAVAIIHDPTDKGTQSAKYKKTRKHIAATASKHGAVPAIMRFVNGGYVVHRVRGG